MRTELQALQDENARLRRAVTELGLLNEVATALGTAHDLGTALRRVVHRAREAVGAEQGTVTLVGETAGPEGETLIRTVVQTSPHPALRPNEMLLGWMHIYKKPLRLQDPARDERFGGVAWDASVRSVLSAPLLVGGRLVGVLTLYNKRTGEAFSAEDERLLAILAVQSAQVIEHMRLSEERDRILRVFGQHTAPSIVEALLRQGADTQSARRHVCVMFFDLRDFTRRAEAWPPEQVVDFLNQVFTFAIEVVHRHHGAVHQLLGDGFLALFGAPVSAGNDSRNAVRAALGIVERIRAACEVEALPPTRVSIGLHSGEAIAGTVGSQIHQEYKVVGDVVNVAARIEEATRRLDAQVLASEAVVAELDEVEAEPLGTVALRGRGEPVRLYRLA